MTHCTEDDLVLYYYGESSDAEVASHLASCPRCADAYRSLKQTLQIIAAPDVPERDAAYGRQIWARVSAQLPERRHFWSWTSWAMAATAAAVVVAAFLAGRMWPATQAPGGFTTVAHASGGQ